MHDSRVSKILFTKLLQFSVNKFSKSEVYRYVMYIYIYIFCMLLFGVVLIGKVSSFFTFKFLSMPCFKHFLCPTTVNETEIISHCCE
jgi:hypothetical protein